jgi:hypothetical protein
VTVTALLEERGQLEGVGGPAFLGALSEEVGFAVNAEYYAKLMHDKARLRRFLDKTQQVSVACFGPVENTSQFLDQAMQELYEVAGTGAHHQVFPLDNLVKSETQVIEQIYEKHQQPGIPAGYHDLGKLFSWVPGDLMILAARPSMGKTALALNFTWRIAQNGIPGLIFTKAATVMVLFEALKYEKADNLFKQRHWAHYLNNFEGFHQATIIRLRERKKEVRLEAYTTMDIYDLLDEVPAGAVAIAFLPTYAGGYERMFKRLEDVFDWDRPSYGLIDAERKAAILEKMKQRDFLFLDDKEWPDLPLVAARLLPPDLYCGL